jgi:hypothetical protein
MRAFLRTRSIAVVGAVLAATASLNAQSTSAARTDDPTSVAFRVVGPDGGTVRNPYVFVSVFGKTYSTPRLLHGTALGWVTVPLPTDDVVAAERLAEGEPVNMMIRVFDKKPGSDNINAAYITASVGVDAFGVLRELSKTSGQTFELMPGRTAFTSTAPGTAINPVAPGDTVYGVTSEEQPCPPSPNQAPYICDVEDLPPWADDVRITVANNHGGGNEMASTLHYNNTIVTQAQAVVQVGAGGYFAASGTTAFDQQRKGGLTFPDTGPNNTVSAILQTIFKRKRSGMCYTDSYNSGTWNCQVETTYTAHWADGAFTGYSPAIHDRLDSDSDCYRHVASGWEADEKSEESHGFSFQLGPNENWAPASEGWLYANTTTTQQTTTGNGLLRRWTVAGGSYEHHWVYVPDMAGVQMTVESPSCPGAFIGQVRTQASNIDYALKTVDPLPVPVERPPADPPSSRDGTGTVCGNMPDRCD